LGLGDPSQGLIPDIWVGYLMRQGQCRSELSRLKVATDTGRNILHTLAQQYCGINCT
jgi:hypothetical protein